MVRVHKACTAAVVVLVIAVSACGETSIASPTAAPSQARAPHSESPSAPISLPSASPSASPVTSLANGAALPACEPGVPADTDTAAFVASGHAWALNPNGTDLTCMFAVADPGPFRWGPLGDRALLAGLEVKGLGDAPSVAASGQRFTAITWSRPTGKSIVYAAGDGTSLEKVHLDGTRTQKVTPLGPSKYLGVAYHPSGEAFAFAVDQSGMETASPASIWMSSNTGKNPVQLVFSNEGTTFGALGFDIDGKRLYYAAQHADNHADLHSIDVTDPTKAPVVWEGPTGSAILDIQPGQVSGSVAWTAGTSCDDSVAMALGPAGLAIALPDAAGPTNAIGWLGESTLLVATGGCGDLLDLTAVDVPSGTASALVSGVDAAAVRTPVATPPAPLPKAVATQGSGFS